MIDTVLVISKGGIPLFDYDRELGSSEGSDTMIIQSGFLTAMNSFAKDIKAEDLRYVVFNKKTYVITEANELLLVFAKNGTVNLGEIPEMDEKLLATATYMKNSLSKEGFTGEEYPDQDKLNNLYSNLGEYLYNNGILPKKPAMNIQRTQSNIRKALFRSVGYVPGQCNIGPAERQRRLNYGILWIAVGLIAGLIMLNYLDSTPELRLIRLILIIPFFIGFQGFYQYFFKFCVTNAFSKKYNMS